MYILLYAEPQLRDPSDIPKIQEHATEILNISISDMPDCVRCFSITPLFYAGKHIEGIQKKTRALMLLDNIQQQVGHSSRIKVEALQQLLK
jgi:hypothetical protein